MAIMVAGDSMAPKYPHGTRVFIKRIDDSLFINWGEVYVLDTTNGVIIKKVAPSDKPDCLRCVSLNPAPEYAPFDVPKKEVRALYRVLVSMTQEAAG